MSSAVPLPVGLRPQIARRRKSPFFLMLGLLMLVLAIGGFWPQYFSAVTGRPPEATTQFWLIHLHAAIFVAWLLAYISQAAMVATGRTPTHLKMGPWLAGFGFAAALFGLFAASRLAVRLGERSGNFEEAASFVFFPFIDMVYLAGFLAVAVVFRKRPEIHKRAMFLATFSVAVVGVGRLIGKTGIDNPFIWQPLILAPIAIALVFDAAVYRKVYAVMVAGVIVHLTRLNAEAFVASEWWLPVGRALIAPLR